MKKVSTLKTTKTRQYKKNRTSVHQSSDKRKTMCGLGTRKVKCFLNSMIRKGDKIAELYRIALEIEDENIKAKDNLYYSQAHYNKKEELVYKLIELCDTENIVYGIQISDVRDTNKIIYFELPDCEQISWHCNMKENIVNKCPLYKKKWDGKINSTLNKLENAIINKYGDILKTKYKQML